MRRDDSWIDERVAAQRPGWSLDGAFYTDPDVFRRDRERIFDRQWIMAGHVSQVPKPGDYFLFELAGDCLILIRGRDGIIRALHNVCRHRGSRVLLEAVGNAASLTCTYHGWTYGQDGSLRVAPRMPDDFDRACFGLKSCHVRLLEGLIFVCAGDEPAGGFARVAEGLAPFLALHGCAQAKIARRTLFPVAANWKLAVENYLECYHCKPAHPEYCAVEIKAEMIGDGNAAGVEAYEKRLADWRPGAEGRGTWIDEFNSNSGALEDDSFFGAAYRAPLRSGFCTGSEDGKAVAPLMDGFHERDGGETALGAGPCTYMLSYQDYMGFFQFVPRDATSSDMIVTWLVNGDAEEGKDYDPDKVAWLWTVTSEQDKTIIEHNAQGIASPAYEPGPSSLLERDVDAFRAWYLASIAPGQASTDLPPLGGGRYFPL